MKPIWFEPFPGVGFPGFIMREYWFGIRKIIYRTNWNGKKWYTEMVPKREIFPRPNHKPLLIDYD